MAQQTSSNPYGLEAPTTPPPAWVNDSGFKDWWAKKSPQSGWNPDYWQSDPNAFRDITGNYAEYQAGQVAGPPSPLPQNDLTPSDLTLGEQSAPSVTQQPTYANTPGWENTKLNDPMHTSVKYQFQRTVQDMGLSGAQARGNLQPIVERMKTNYPNAQVVGDDKIDFGDGYGPIDVIQGGSNAWWWGPSGGGTTSPTNRPAGPAMATNTGGATTNPPLAPLAPLPSPAFRGTSTPNNLGSDYTDLYNLLMERAKQGLTVDPNDPVIRNQADAYSANATRSMRDYLAQAAEQGGEFGNLNTETRGAYEQLGQSTGTYESQLVANEISARRAEIQQALSGAAGLLTAQQQLQLTEELRKLELAQQQYQFGSTQAQQESEFERKLKQQGYEFDINDLWRNSPNYGA